MVDFKIDAEERTVVGKKVKNVRKVGLVPATIYGPKIDPVSLQIPYRPLEVALMTAGGTNLIDIKVGKTIHTVLTRDVQRDKIKGTILHVDFMAVDLTSTIRADVPIVLTGVSEVVEAREGILITGTNTVTIETLPDKLLNQIEVDLSVLEEIGDTITIGDIHLDESIVVINDPEELVAGVRTTSAARAEDELLEEEELEEVEDMEGVEPEVIARGKEEEEEEE